MTIRDDIDAVLAAQCCSVCHAVLAPGETYRQDDEEGLPRLPYHTLRWLERSDGDREWRYRCDRSGWMTGTLDERPHTVREMATPELLRALEGLR